MSIECQNFKCVIPTDVETGKPWEGGLLLGHLGSFQRVGDE